MEVERTDPCFTISANWLSITIIYKARVLLKLAYFTGSGSSYLQLQVSGSLREACREMWVVIKVILTPKLHPKRWKIKADWNMNQKD